MGKRSKETITLGSGKLYSIEYTGTIPSNTEIEKTEKTMGRAEKNMARI